MRNLRLKDENSIEKDQAYHYLNVLEAVAEVANIQTMEISESTGRIIALFHAGEIFINAGAIPLKDPEDNNEEEEEDQCLN